MSNMTLGIDVSKLELSTALLKDKRPIKAKFSNNIAGFKKLHQWLNKNKASDIKICMEATGHYCFEVANFFYSKGYTVYVVNPFCIKAFADTKLSRNKTDEADAVIIAEYIKQNEVRAYKPASKMVLKIRALDKSLEEMKLHKARVKNQLSNAEYLPKEVTKIWKNTLKHLESQIKNIELLLHELINSDVKFKQDFKNLQTIPGISKTTAITILALVPNIDDFDNARQLAAFAGVTPKQRQSGSSIKGKSRLSKIGSRRLRKSIFFPAMSAKKHNPIVKTFCDNLAKKSKAKMVIIGAAMRKLMHIIFAVLKHKTSFNPNISFIQ